MKRDKMARYENELVDRLNHESNESNALHRRIKNIRLNTDREQMIVHQNMRKQSERQLNLEEEIRARPYLEVEEIHKYNRGDFPLFFNQSRKVRNQYNNTMYNSQFENDYRTMKKDHLIASNSSNDNIETKLYAKHRVINA